MARGPKGSARTADLLSGRRARKPSADRPEVGYRSELGARPVVRKFELGPFPHLAVASFPAKAVELLERRTGRSMADLAQVLAEWERIRAFLGYEPFELTPDLVSAQRLGPPEGHAEGVTPEPPARARHLASGQPIPEPEIPDTLGMPDPHDLGD